MRRFLLLATLFIVLLPACAGDEDSVDGVVEGESVSVEMYDNRFQFIEVRVPVGGTVQWIGAGRNPHNAVSASEEWSTEQTFGTLSQFEGDVASITYTEPGEYIFFCTFHGNAEGEGMAGKLVVGGA